MRHETRVWILPAVLAVGLCGLAFVPSKPPEPEPPPFRALPEDGRERYLEWIVVSRMLPPPFSPGVDLRQLLPRRVRQAIDARRAYPRSR